MSESTRAEFLKTLETVMSTHGIEPSQAQILTTTAYQTEGLLNLYDQVSYANYVARREMFPSTAQFINSLYKWNKIANASIDTATPSSRIFYLSFDIDDMMQESENIGDKLYTFTIPVGTTLSIDSFIYTLDYAIVTKVFDPDGIASVTAHYDTDASTNSISKLVNPNIKVIKQNRNITLVLVVYQYEKVYKSYRYLDISTDIKTLTYDDQLIDFNVYYRKTEFTETPVALDKSMYFQRIIPENPTIYYALESGSVSLLNRGYRGNFYPIADSLIEIVMYITKGDAGNFQYTSDSVTINISDEISTKISVTCEIDYSTAGASEDTIEEIRTKILTSLHSRESLISENDLNALFISENKPYKVIKTRDDLLYRIYSVYLPMYIDGILIPANTMNIRFDYNDCVTGTPTSYCKIPEDAVFEAVSNVLATRTDSPSEGGLNYKLDKVYMINKEKRLIESYEKYINRNYPTTYTYSYDMSRYVYMINKINIFRGKDGIMKLSFNLMTNLNDEVIELHKKEDDGTITDIGKVEVYIVIRGANKSIKGYMKAKMMNYLTGYDLYEYEAIVDTDYFIHNSTFACILSNLDTVGTVNVDTSGDSIEMVVCDDIRNTSKSLSDYNINGTKGISNIFTVDNVDFIKSYSSIMYTRMIDTDETIKTLTDIPMLGASFYDRHYADIYEALYAEYDYIDTLYLQTQANFDTSVKFVNTYGMSRIHCIGTDGTNLNRVNLTMTFRVGLAYNASVDFAYIKNYIKNFISAIDFLEDATFHVSDLITAIKNDIADLERIEFVSINGYDTKYQYIYTDYDSDDPSIVPECITFDLDDDDAYNINLIKL